MRLLSSCRLPAGVQCLELLPTHIGQSIVLATARGELTFFSLLDMEECASVRTGYRGIKQIVAHPYEGFLLLNTEMGLAVYDPAIEKAFDALPIKSAGFHFVQPFPRQNCVLCIDDEFECYIVDLLSGKPKLVSNCGTANSICIHPNEIDVLASVSSEDGSTIVFAEIGEEDDNLTLRVKSDYVKASFSPDGKHFVYGRDVIRYCEFPWHSDAEQWRFSLRAEDFVSRDREDEVGGELLAHDLTFSPAGDSLYIKTPGDLYKIDVRRPSLVEKASPHEGRRFDFVVTPDGRNIVSIGNDRKLKVWATA